MSKQQRLIEQALLVMMVNTPFDEITMSDLITHTGLGRATFYRYFKSKVDILDAINERIRLDIEAKLRETVQKIGPGQSFIVYVAETLDAYYEHRDELKILWGENTTGNSVIRLVEQAKPFLGSYVNVKSADTRHIPTDYAINLSLGTYVTMMIFWLTKPLPEKPEIFKTILLNAFNTPPMNLIEKV
ncbi:MAG TPA: TetR/AcrR family transcriptional regulator [Lactobacillaceae bacterium]|jgi:AcrR family transcriptional regulator